MVDTLHIDEVGVMKKILIVGAGGFGREILSWVKDTFEGKDGFEIVGFLDADSHVLDNYECPFPILGDPSTYQPRPDDQFVCALGQPKIKLKVCKDLKDKGGSFLTLIHPTAVVGDRCTFGEGCVLCPGAVITTDVTLGDFVIINAQATVGHDASIGDGSTLSGHADVTGFAQLGEGVFMGSHACVLPNAKIGDYATVGAGSVVLRKVKPHTTVMGVPAKKLV